jgi:hypothetical protein
VPPRKGTLQLVICNVQPKAAATAKWATLAEIDENLVRRDLTPTERAKLTAERKQNRASARQHILSDHRKMLIYTTFFSNL